MNCSAPQSKSGLLRDGGWNAEEALVTVVPVGGLGAGLLARRDAAAAGVAPRVIRGA